MKLKVLIACTVAIGIATHVAVAQKRKLGAVCGDPTSPCKAHKDAFQSYDLPFDQGKNFVIYESQPFYGIILKSKKLKDWGDCGNPSFKEEERLEIQKLFEHNKVFSQNCVESGTYYYTQVADQTAFMGIYAGRTLAEANKFLKMIQATNKFPGVRLRRMRVAVNGT